MVRQCEREGGVWLVEVACIAVEGGMHFYGGSGVLCVSPVLIYRGCCRTHGAVDMQYIINDHCYPQCHSVTINNLNATMNTLKVTMHLVDHEYPHHTSGCKRLLHGHNIMMLMS